MMLALRKRAGEHRSRSTPALERIQDKLLASGGARGAISARLGELRDARAQARIDKVGLRALCLGRTAASRTSTSSAQLIRDI
jgi:hypothetical protein